MLGGGKCKELTLGVVKQSGEISDKGQVHFKC